MPSSNKPSLSDRQVLQALAVLKKRALYNGKLRGKTAPTKYGRELAKKYSDVIEGRAHVVTIKSNIKRNKGYKEAREFKETNRVVKNKVIVPKTFSKERVTYSRKTGDIRVTSHNTSGSYVRIKRKKKVQTLADLSALKKNQRYVVTFNRGKGHEPDTPTFESKEELISILGEYERTGRYKNIASNVDVIEYRPGKLPSGYEIADEDEEDDE